MSERLFADVFAEEVEQLVGDGAGFAGADLAAVDFGDGDDFGGGAGEEAFVSDVDIVTGHGDFFEGDVGLLRQMNDGVAGDAFEDAGVFGGGRQLAVFDQEDVVAGAFRDVTFVVHHNGFFLALIGGFDLGEDVVEIIERFNSWREGLRVVADCRGGDNLHAVFVQFLRIHFDLVSDDDDLRVGRPADIEAEPPCPTSDDESDVTIGQAVGSDGFVGGVDHFFRRHRDDETDGFGGFVEAVDVLFEEEDLLAVNSQSLEDTVSV